jgi:ribonuclease HII
MQTAFIRRPAVDEAGAGIAVKNTAHSTIILLQGYDVAMQRINMANVAERRTDSRKRIIAVVGIAAIVQRDGKRLVRAYKDLVFALQVNTKGCI